MPDPLLNVKQRTVVTALNLPIGGGAFVLMRLYAWLRMVLKAAFKLLLSVPFHDVVKFGPASVLPRPFVDLIQLLNDLYLTASVEKLVNFSFFLCHLLGGLKALSLGPATLLRLLSRKCDLLSAATAPLGELCHLCTRSDVILTCGTQNCLVYHERALISEKGQLLAKGDRVIFEVETSVRCLANLVTALVHLQIDKVFDVAHLAKFLVVCFVHLRETFLLWCAASQRLIDKAGERLVSLPGDESRVRFHNFFIIFNTSNGIKSIFSLAVGE